MQPFFVKDCALAVISTGESANSLAEMREILKRIPVSSIYYHFWGERLRPSFIHPEYINDFARWAHFGLHDEILAERLEIIDPIDYKDLEQLRECLLDIIERRLAETELFLASKKDEKFHFLRSVSTIFDTPIVVNYPTEWKSVMPNLSISSIFYHFIDARKRTPQAIDDFTFWFLEFKDEYSNLVNRIQHIDPYFFNLTEVKQKLIEAINEFFQ